jgi:hypothetical protein
MTDDQDPRLSRPTTKRDHEGGPVSDDPSTTTEATADTTSQAADANAAPQRVER